MFQNGIAKQDDLRLTIAGEARGRRRENHFEDYPQNLRTNPLQTPLLTQDMTIKRTNKPALVQYLVSIRNWVTYYSGG
jgi:hypothetical protein